MLNELITKVTESAKQKVLSNEKIMRRIEKDKLGRNSETTETIVAEIVFEEIDKLKIDCTESREKMNLLTSLENCNIKIAKNIIASV